MSLKNTALVAVFVFMLFSVFLFVQHELFSIHQDHSNSFQEKFLRSSVTFSKEITEEIDTAKYIIKEEFDTAKHAVEYLIEEFVHPHNIVHETGERIPMDAEEQFEIGVEEEAMLAAQDTSLSSMSAADVKEAEIKMRKSIEDQATAKVEEAKEEKALQQELKKQASAHAKMKSPKDEVEETYVGEEEGDIIQFNEETDDKEKHSNAKKDSTNKIETVSFTTAKPISSKISTDIKELEGDIAKERLSESHHDGEVELSAFQQLQVDADRVPEVDVSSIAAHDKHWRKVHEKPGTLTCNGRQIESEVIYWKVVPGDDVYESPVTPHHGIHHDRYVSFEYDNGGWNNIRMAMECVVVMAHAMGRSLVIPPQQHLYLLGQQHKDAHDTQAHDEMGFEDYYNISLFKGHSGLHAMEMEDFLAKEGVTGGLNGILPPGNTSQVWGGKLWGYLNKAADATPMWLGKFLAMPDHPGNFTYDGFHGDMRKRLHDFGGDRTPVFYDEALQNAHHIHFRGDSTYRVLQHHYAFVFFADPNMQSFYKRFIRDFMRYNDYIQCAGHELLAAVRNEARSIDPSNTRGEFYALHVRRGDFQFKDVKISAADIVKNLHYPNGTSVIPAGAVVYLSTDDPEGLCKNCYVNKKPCTSYEHGQKPPGCPEDTSWVAFHKAGWKLRFLGDFMKKDGVLKGVNPNTFGMIESIVCSRATVFAGTWFSTFTGYIHRMRGYHGLAESTFYHSTGKLLSAQKKESVGHGFTREWRYGWTDDQGELIR